MWHDLLTAVALVLVIEGVMPFLSPKHWRNTMLKLAQGSDKSIRIMGFVSMVLGAVIMYFVRGGTI